MLEDSDSVMNKHFTAEVVRKIRKHRESFVIIYICVFANNSNIFAPLIGVFFKITLLWTYIDTVGRIINRHNSFFCKNIFFNSKSELYNFCAPSWVF